MRLSLLLAVLVFGFPAISDAHFIWLLTDSAGTTGRVQVFFGEAAEPDDPDLLSRVEKAKVWTVGWRGDAAAVPLELGEESLDGSLSERARQSPVVLSHTYGVFTRGDSSFLLNYYA